MGDVLIGKIVYGTANGRDMRALWASLCYVPRVAELISEKNSVKLKELAGMDIYDKVAIVTDGRFSGGSSGLSIGYVAPEAAIKGPLAAVQNGDKISIDVPNRKINIDLTDEEIADRLSKVDWKLQEEKFKPFLRLFARNVSSTAKGATWL